MAPSTSQATLLVRTYAALLHQADCARQADADQRCATPTGPSSATSTACGCSPPPSSRSTTTSRIAWTWPRNATDRDSATGCSVQDLTSRADSSEIPALPRSRSNALSLTTRSVDVLLATNMISVGVDIDRLGLMAVMGQPQTTAEYIQATSRVGRKHPGLVAVMLNATRSRDRSHYESFPTFHSALYREVESTSVTPFSARARDRGLHAVIVALTRLLVPGAAGNGDAANIARFVDRVRSIVRTAILDRVATVDAAEKHAVGDQIDAFIEWWEELAEEHQNLVYEARGRAREPALLSGFDSEDDLDEGQPTLWSLRDVDAESVLFLENKR